MSNKIPTAEEFVRTYKVDDKGNIREENRNKSSYDMILEFAKLHVEAALKAAAKNAKIEPHFGPATYEDCVDESSILNAYPLTNIK